MDRGESIKTLAALRWLVRTLTGGDSFLSSSAPVAVVDDLESADIAVASRAKLRNSPKVCGHKQSGVKTHLLWLRHPLFAVAPGTILFANLGSCIKVQGYDAGQ